MNAWLGVLSSNFLRWQLIFSLFKRTQFLSRGQDLRYKIIWRFRWGHETVFFYFEYETLNIRLKKRSGLNLTPVHCNDLDDWEASQTALKLHICHHAVN